MRAHVVSTGENTLQFVASTRFLQELVPSTLEYEALVREVT
jgi:hypothetical protein